MDNVDLRNLLERMEAVESINQRLVRETRRLRRILLAVGIGSLSIMALGATMAADFPVVVTQRLIVQHPQGNGSRVEISAAPNGEGIYFYDDNNKQRIKLESGEFGTLLLIDGNKFP